jgi:hypothetical protein
MELYVLPKGPSSDVSPPLRGEVPARSRKSRGASLARADGVVFNLNKIQWNLITPVRSIKEASRYFIEVAAPLLEEEGKIADLRVEQQPLQGVFHRTRAEARDYICV